MSIFVAMVIGLAAYRVTALVCDTYERTRQETIEKTVSDLRRRLLRQEAFAGEKHHLFEGERRRANYHRERCRKLRSQLREARGGEAK